MATTGVSKEVVKKWAPMLQFHENERHLPCSIEHILGHATLKFRKWVFPSKLRLKHSSSVSIASFKGGLYLAYKERHTSEIIIQRALYPVKNGQDPSWEPLIIPGRHSVITPAIHSFQDSLVLAYASGEQDSPSLCILSSQDGSVWTEPNRVIECLVTSISIGASADEVYIVYETQKDKPLLCVRSRDGRTWTQPEPVPHTQGGTNPALAQIGTEMLLLYIVCGSDSQGLVYQATYTPALSQEDKSDGVWSLPRKTNLDRTQSICVCSIGSPVLIYSSTGTDELRYASSTDGFMWHCQGIISHQANIASAALSNGNLCLAWADNNDQWLGVNLCHLQVPFDEDEVSIENPSMADLYQTSKQKHPDQYYLDVQPSAQHGQPIGQAPVYFAINEDQDTQTLTIHYIILYAHQYGQAIRRRKPLDYDCIIWDIGSHQGDLERFAITLNRRDLSFKSATFEAHGKSATYDDYSTIHWTDGTHAIVSVGLCSHAQWNRHPLAISDNPHYAFPNWRIETDVPGVGEVFVGLADFTGSEEAMRWRSWEVADFRRLGLSEAGEPIGEQLWAAFAGRLGNSGYAYLQGASSLDGKPLGRAEDEDVRAVFGSEELLSLLPADKIKLQGPDGPGRRNWIRSGGSSVSRIDQELQV